MLGSHPLKHKFIAEPALTPSSFAKIRLHLLDMQHNALSTGALGTVSESNNDQPLLPTTSWCTHWIPHQPPTCKFLLSAAPTKYTVTYTMDIILVTSAHSSSNQGSLDALIISYNQINIGTWTVNHTTSSGYM